MGDEEEGERVAAGGYALLGMRCSLDIQLAVAMLMEDRVLKGYVTCLSLAIYEQQWTIPDRGSCLCSLMIASYRSCAGRR